MNKLKRITAGIVAIFALTAVINAETLYIGTKDELKAFRDNVNNGNTYSGSTIYLTADIDLSGESWTPIAHMTYSTHVNNDGFQGTFDGQGYKIVNLNVNIESTSAVTLYYAYGGLFSLNRGVIKNVFIENATIYVKSRAINNSSLAGAIAAVNRGTITNCCVKSSTITAHNNYGLLGQVAAHSYAAGIAACNYDSSSIISYCYVNDDVTVNATRSNNSTDLHSNDISNAWDSSNNQVDCVINSSAYGSMTSGGFRQLRNTYAWIKNNFSLDELLSAGIITSGDYTTISNAEPYTWDENGITPDRHFYFNTSDAWAEAGSTRITDGNLSAAVVTSPSIPSSYVRDNVVDVYSVDYVNINGQSVRYNLYPAGTTVNVRIGLEGWNPEVAKDGWCRNAGWFVDKTYLTHSLTWNPSYERTSTDENGSISNDDREETGEVSESTNRQLRYQSISYTTPSEPTTFAYTTINKDGGEMTSVGKMSVSTFKLTGGKGHIAVSADKGQKISIYDLAGRMVYQGVSSGSIIDIELAPGIYVANGKKVVVK